MGHRYRLPKRIERPDFEPVDVDRARLVLLPFSFRRVHRDGSDFVLCSEEEFCLEPGSRIGLVGPNGRGKSTLLRLLSQEEPLEGDFLRVDRKAKVALVDQFDRIDPLSTPLDHTRDLVGWSVEKRRGMLSRYGLKPDTHTRPVSTLSGGEKRNLSLMIIAQRHPNILLLDEPTNHLDIDSIDSLCDTLDGYAGALVLSSHNVHVIRRLCTEIWVVDEGRLAKFDGSIDDYVEVVREAIPETS